MPDLTRFKLAVEHNEVTRKGKIVKKRRAEYYKHLDAARTRAGFLIATGYKVKITRGKEEVKVFP